MALSHIGRLLTAETRKEIDEIQQYLGRGDPVDYTEYRYYVGKIAGMLAVLDILSRIEGSD